MNVILLSLFIPSILVVLGFKIFAHDTVSGKEMIVQAIVPVVLIAGVWNISKYSMFADSQIMNGKIVSKDQVWVSCSHSYACRCRIVSSGSGKSRTSRQVCDTCYRHSNDWDWRVYTTLGNFNVERVDSRGSQEPHRWTLVEKDQPYAKASYYSNPIRAAPDSLFHFAKAAAYKGPLAAYPDVYDYQYVDRVIGVGMNVPDAKLWNDLLSRSLNDMGNRKQVNINLIITNQRPMFADALKAEWLGGKKNDVTVIIGTTYPDIKWVRVFSWSKHDIVNVALRNNLLESKTLSPTQTVGIIAGTVDRYYERRPMEDFAYLEDEVVPPTWVIILALLLSCGAAIGLGIFFHQNECFEGGNLRRFRR